MFAAAVLVLRWIWDAAAKTVMFIATKLIALFLVTVVLQFVLRKVFIWAAQYYQAYGAEVSNYASGLFSDFFAALGIQQNISVELTGVGGYLAVQTGLVDAVSIIVAGWAVYWLVWFTTKTLLASNWYR